MITFVQTDRVNYLDRAVTEVDAAAHQLVLHLVNVSFLPAHALAVLPASSAQRSSALPPSDTPATHNGAALRARRRARIQPTSSWSPEW